MDNTNPFKVIVTGTTGFVGSGVVKACIARKEISEIVVLSRRPLPFDLDPGANRSLKVIIHEDFSKYPEDLTKEFSGADACIWYVGLPSNPRYRGAKIYRCIGGKVGDFPDYETAKKVQYDFTVAFAEFCEKSIRPREETGRKEFRFVFCSGAFAEREEKKSLWWGDKTRKLKVRSIPVFILPMHLFSLLIHHHRASRRRNCSRLAIKTRSSRLISCDPEAFFQRKAA